MAVDMTLKNANTQCYNEQGEKHGSAAMGVDGCTVATAAVYF